ncbi:MAG: ATP-binding cassette domain-containing protein [Bacteroidota bacterium]
MPEEIIINLNDISVFQQDNLILSNINLAISKGEFVYLIGKVGSGKTSLIKTLYAELPLREGSAEIAGYILKKIKQKQVPYLRRKTGIVFQDFQLLNDRNVHDNLMFVMKATGWKQNAETEARITEVLEMVGQADKLHKMPHQLSGGEQQQVVIARALLNQPDIILADEPTGNLDPESSDVIMGLLRKISSNGTAVLMATHNYPLLKKYPARILKCENGKLFELSENVEAIEFEALEL